MLILELRFYKAGISEKYWGKGFDIIRQIQIEKGSDLIWTKIKQVWHIVRVKIFTEFHSLNIKYQVLSGRKEYTLGFPRAKNLEEKIMLLRQ